VKEGYMIFFPLAMGLWHMIAQICIAGSNIPLSSSSPPLDDKPESFPTIDVEPCSLAVRGVKNFGDSMPAMDRLGLGFHGGWWPMAELFGLSLVHMHNDIGSFVTWMLGLGIIS
jgi:hypothetical protein